MRNHKGQANPERIQGPVQLEHIEAIEKSLWNAADTLRSNSNYASNEYFMPVMGLIFLRHAYSRYLTVKEGIEANLPKRGGKTRALRKEDFTGKGAIFLRPEAQFDYLVALTDGDDRAKAIIDAMETIEEDYETLRGVLPKTEYKEIENEVLWQLLRTFNDEALKRATGDVFGRIYEYFLNKFADRPRTTASSSRRRRWCRLIVNVIEPDHGMVLDPACGSGGMFVQSGHFIERHGQDTADDASPSTARRRTPPPSAWRKMNLAVHGLEGNISRRSHIYDEDPHELAGGAIS